MTQALPSSPPRPSNRKQRRLAAKRAKQGANAPSPTAANGMLARLNTATDLHRRGAFDEAEAIYRALLDEDPENGNALCLLGAMTNQRGRREEALQLLRRAVAAIPNNPAAHNNLGVVCAALGQLDEAARHYETAIELRPGDAETHRNLALVRYRQERWHDVIACTDKALALQAGDLKDHLLLATTLERIGSLERAVTHYETVIELEPDNTTMRCKLGQLLIELGQGKVALDRILEAMAAEPHDKNAQIILMQALGAAPIQGYQPELASALVRCFEDAFVEHARIAGHAAYQVKLKYRDSKQASDLQPGGTARDTASQARQRMDGILADELLIRLLHSAVNVDPEFEVFLTALRRAVLFSAQERSEMPEAALRFMVALACQCHHNSYVFFADDEEAAELDKLATVIERLSGETGTVTSALELRLSLYAMYAPLAGLSVRKQLLDFAPSSWSETIAPLIRHTLLNPSEEAENRQSIPFLVAVEDEVSQAVRSQYEENPYPRWISFPETERCDLEQHLQELFPHFEPPGFLSEPLEILVAGCGTGQHPLSTARHYRNVTVTAVDLSRASLAYASRMGQSLGIENAGFFQGDILGLACLDRQFPVIECVGVLHHMKEPDEGLEVLVDLLRPGGLLRLGLYSEVARRSVVVEARQRIAELELAPTAENIRGFRRDIIQGRELPGSQLPGLKDFYDLDSCRDLIFHVQEHRFTIPRLRDFLGRQSLEFLGFHFRDPETLKRYRSHFPDDEEMRNLDLWQQFEQENPGTFIGMYQFWCQKPA